MKKINCLKWLAAAVICLVMVFSGEAHAQELFQSDTLKVSQDGNTVQVDVYTADAAVTSVLLPVWTESGGQDDILWHSAVYKGNGIWSAQIHLRDYGYASDKYNIHAYACGSDSSMTLIAGQTVPVSSVMNCNISVVNKDDMLGTFRVKLDQVCAPFDIKQILIPVWSDQNGQDDICWYTARQEGQSWIVDVDALNHRADTGRYTVHVYYQNAQGNLTLAGWTSVSVSLNAAKDVRLESVMSEDQSIMTITLKNCLKAESASEVYIPVWTGAGGQDDICWYKAEKTGKMTWKADVPLSDHNYERGLYNFHAYIKNADGSMEFIAGATTEVKKPFGGKPTLIVNENQEQTGFTVTLYNAPVSAGEKVYFPVWSEDKGQDDIVWYTAVQSADVWYADIDVRNHRCCQGTYNIHCYAGDIAGNMEFVGAVTRDVDVEIVGDGGLSPYVAATSWIIYDKNSNKVLYSRNPDGVVWLASQTKIMTAMVVLEHVSDLNAPVTMTASANSGMTWDTTRAGLIVGRQYTVRTLLEGLMVYSGGDCANLLAEYVAGSVPAFVQLMNQKAAELGMSSTVFSDPIGLYDNHTTPREYMKLASCADDNAVLRSIVQMPSCTVADVNGYYARTLRNSNGLVSGSVAYDHSAYIVDGMKTGFTDQAGYCLTATGYDSRYRYIVAAFNCGSNTQRAVDCRTLLNHVLIY